jgi:hypothetical protein
VLWDLPNDAQWAVGCGGTSPFKSSDPFCGAPLNLFDCHPDVQDSTMKALLCTGGGSNWAQKAARDVIAAYLNASCGEVAFGMTPSAVAALWNAAVAGGITFESVHNTLAALNDPTPLDECPLGRVRIPTLVRAGTEDGQTEPASESQGSALELYRPTPNPFVSTTRIAYAISAGAGERVEIGVYDVAGRLIRALVGGHVNPGRYETSWDGRNEEGARVTNGLYFVHVSTGRARRTLHVVYLR